MFCNKCGNEIRRGDRFCPNCGAKAASASCSVCGSRLLNGETVCPVCSTPVQTAVSRSSVPQLDELGKQLRSGIKHVQKYVPANLDDLSQKAVHLRVQVKPYLQAGEDLNRPIAYFGVALMQVLMVFLWFGDFITLSMFGHSETLTMHELFAEAENLSYITVALLILGAVFTFLPTMKPFYKKFKGLFVPKVTTVWTMLMFIVGWYSGSETEKSYAKYDANVSLTMGGCVLGFLCAASVILIFLMSTKKKSAPRRARYVEKTTKQIP